MIFEDFIRYGRDLFLMGLNNSHSGNMSIRKNDSIFITRHGAQLGSLSSSDIVRTNLDNEKLDKNASYEIKVHRAIYKNSPASAIVHAHPPIGIAVSLKQEKVIPIDMEGPFYLPEIPVLFKCEKTISSDCVADELPKLLKDYKIVLVRGHGSFAVGRSIEEAYQWTSVCESICKIIWISKTL